MHTHVVMVKLADPHMADECLATMRSMEGRIDGMVALECRCNDLAGDHSYDVMLRTTWADRAAYLAYQVDPIHVAVAERVRGWMTDAATIDWTED